jgi:hypothetical protein
MSPSTTSTKPTEKKEESTQVIRTQPSLSVHRQSGASISNTFREDRNEDTRMIPFSEVTIDVGNIGFGGQGFVQKGKWGNNDVAVKLSLSYTDEQLDKEMQILCKLNHPSILIKSIRDLRS